MVALEALALGRPVVAPDTGGLGEILVHGENGYLYAPDRVDQLVDAIMAVGCDADRARELGSKGLDSIADAYSLDAVATSYRQVYEEAIHAAA